MAENEAARLRRRLRRLRRRMRRERARRHDPRVPEEFLHPDPCIGKVVITGFGRDRFAGFGKVDEAEFWPPFVYALYREGIACEMLDDPARAVEACRAPETVVINVYHEVRGEHRLLRDFERGLAGALVFNPAALGPKVARKDRTARILRRAGIPVPRRPEELAADAPVFCHDRRSSGAAPALLPAGGDLPEGAHCAEFIDTRRPFRGEMWHSMLRLSCVGEEMHRCAVRLRPDRDGSPSVRLTAMPRDAEAIEHFRRELIEQRREELAALARRVGEVLGPGFYSHDVVASAKTGELAVVESGLKFTDLGRRMRPVAAYVAPGYIASVPAYADACARAFLGQCRARGFLLP